MPSPFPGIDPFLEAQGYWPDLHSSAIIYARDALSAHLPDAYDIRVEERINLVESATEDSRRVNPDLAIERAQGRFAADRGAIELEREPSTLPIAPLEEVRETYLEIIHRSERTLVTVVELLSPENKVATASGQYLAKRNALLSGTVHLVEIDLLIGGHRLSMGRPLPSGDAYALVARVDRRPDCEVYTWSIRQALSTIRIPLLAPDPDIPLDLDALYATTFERGRYGRSIRYDSPLTIYLAPDDRAWAEARAKGPAR